MTNRTAPRDFTAEYVAARADARSAGPFLDPAACKRAATIARAARRAGVELDEITLDEVARVQVHG